MCEIFTDGSSSVIKKNNIRYGGIGVFFGDDNNNNISESFSGPDVTNQRMELQACIYGILKCNSNNIYEIKIYSDSLYLIKIMTDWMFKWQQNQWTKKGGIMNLDLIKKLYDLNLINKLKFQHV